MIHNKTLNKKTMENSIKIKKGQKIKYDNTFFGQGSAKVKYILKAKPNNDGVTEIYITNQGSFTNQDLIGSESYKKRYNK